MAKVVKTTNNSNRPRKIRPAISPEARENQLIALTIDLVEQRLLDGTATSQETTHFLKLASSKARLEKENLEKQGKLIDAKIESLQSADELKEIYKNALEAMRRYSGNANDDEEEYDEYED